MGIKYRGETFAGYNKPKRTPNGPKKYAVLAKVGSEVRLVRFGDPTMQDYLSHRDEKRRANFKARHRCGDPTSKLTPKWWSCNYSW